MESEDIFYLQKQFTASKASTEFNRIFSSLAPELSTNPEIVQHTFPCALKGQIILQGQLYITINNIGFRSAFSSRTVVSREGTKVLIPLSCISQIKKVLLLKLIPNSIEVITDRDQKLLFTSFLNRDLAFNVIKQVLETKAWHTESLRVRSISDDIIVVGCELAHKLATISSQNHCVSLSSGYDIDKKEFLSRASSDFSWETPPLSNSPDTRSQEEMDNETSSTEDMTSVDNENQINKAYSEIIKYKVLPKPYSSQEILSVSNKISKDSGDLEVDEYERSLARGNPRFIGAINNLKNINYRDSLILSEANHYKGRQTNASTRNTRVINYDPYSFLAAVPTDLLRLKDLSDHRVFGIKRSESDYHESNNNLTGLNIQRKTTGPSVLSKSSLLKKTSKTLNKYNNSHVTENSKNSNIYSKKNIKSNIANKISNIIGLTERDEFPTESLSDSPRNTCYYSADEAFHNEETYDWEYAKDRAVKRLDVKPDMLKLTLFDPNVTEKHVPFILGQAPYHTAKKLPESNVFPFSLEHVATSVLSRNTGFLAKVYIDSSVDQRIEVISRFNPPLPEVWDQSIIDSNFSSVSTIKVIMSIKGLSGSEDAEAILQLSILSWPQNSVTPYDIVQNSSGISLAIKTCIPTHSIVKDMESFMVYVFKQEQTTCSLYGFITIALKKYTILKKIIEQTAFSEIHARFPKFLTDLNAEVTSFICDAKNGAPN